MKTFFFYDLETTGLEPDTDRIVQFAGQRTDLDLNPIGDPINILVKLDDDFLPMPEAIKVHKISPKDQDTGISEAELARFLQGVFTQDTVSVGFNNLRFDNDFIRHLFWRNFHDPYEWTWKFGRSTWDVYHLALYTRALRPQGIVWPFREDDPDVPTNKLLELTKANGLTHDKAHDALSDVLATIEVAKLIKAKQPQLFDYFYLHHQKAEVLEFVKEKYETRQPFVYVNSFFGHQQSNMAVVYPVFQTRSETYVFDLQYDPSKYNLTASEIQKSIYKSRSQLQEQGLPLVPVYQIKFNKNPAVAPFSVIESELARLKIDRAEIERNLANIGLAKEFMLNAKQAFETETYQHGTDVEQQLYKDFVPNADRPISQMVRDLDFDQLSLTTAEFQDDRLNELLFRYKARNDFANLTEIDKARWAKFVEDKNNLLEWQTRFDKAFSEADSETQQKLLELKEWVLLKN